MKLIHKHYSNDENFYNLNPLQSAVKFGIISPQSEKVIASREKLIYLLANDSTLLNRAFLFVTFAHLKNMRILFSI